MSTTSTLKSNSSQKQKNKAAGTKVLASQLSLDCRARRSGWVGSTKLISSAFTALLNCAEVGRRNRILTNYRFLSHSPFSERENRAWLMNSKNRLQHRKHIWKLRTKLTQMSYFTLKILSQSRRLQQTISINLLIGLQTIIELVPDDYLAWLKGLLHVNDPLIGRTSELQHEILLCDIKTAVH